MAYKRNIDRLPIPPKDARVQNVTCPFCIVGCGYKAISWDVDKQGGPKATDNFFTTDLDSATRGGDCELVLAGNVQHRQAERPRGAPRHKA
jgi:hypothetical protein